MAELQVVGLVDIDAARARRLAARFGVPFSGRDYGDLYGRVDGVLVCLPNHLHAPVSIDFLSRAIPVLVEKPIARTTAEAEAMAAASRASGAALAVGLVFRHCAGPRLIKQALDQGWLGPLERVTIDWGSMFEWPVASGYAFDPEQAAGGVLLDAGSHIVDLLRWWFGEVTIVEYGDDWQGGVEADCVLSFQVTDRSRLVPGVMTLSRLRNLGNIARIVGAEWTLEWDLRSEDRVALRRTAGGGGPADVVLAGPAFGDQRDALAGRRAQLRRFAGVVDGAGPAPASPEDAIAGLRLIEECYRRRVFRPQPWDAVP